MDALRRQRLIARPDTPAASTAHARTPRCGRSPGQNVPLRRSLTRGSQKPHRHRSAYALASVSADHRDARSRVTASASTAQPNTSARTISGRHGRRRPDFRNRRGSRDPVSAWSRGRRGDHGRDAGPAGGERPLPVGRRCRWRGQGAARGADRAELTLASGRRRAGGGTAVATRARGAQAPGARAHRPRDRPAADRESPHGAPPRGEHPSQARPRISDGGGRRSGSPGTALNRPPYGA
jgi:hypothetical protein